MVLRAVLADGAGGRDRGVGLSDFAENLMAFSRCAKQRLLSEVSEKPTMANGPKAAAVLVPIVPRDDGLTVLLTQRSHELPVHAGQIAFPGGKVDPGDATPLAAALRETHEETGIEPGFVTPVGYLDPYETGTGFRIVPVVGVLSIGFELVPEPGEVSDIFEVPLKFLMDPANHQRKQAMWKGRMRQYDAMPYEDRYIWGATAAMLLELYRRMSISGVR